MFSWLEPSPYMGSKQKLLPLNDKNRQLQIMQKKKSDDEGIGPHL